MPERDRFALEPETRRAEGSENLTNPRLSGRIRSACSLRGATPYGEPSAIEKVQPCPAESSP